MIAAQDDNDYSGTYVRISAGVAQVEDLEGFVDTTIDPRFNFDYSFDPGVRVDFAPGLNFNPYFAFELNTGIIWNDFPWFLIRFRDNQLGFMWGGILCSRGAQVAGTYQTCR